MRLFEFIRVKGARHEPLQRWGILYKFGNPCYRANLSPCRYIKTVSRCIFFMYMTIKLTGKLKHKGLGKQFKTGILGLSLRFALENGFL
jgi:hypothetical protein